MLASIRSATRSALRWVGRMALRAGGWDAATVDRTTAASKHRTPYTSINQHLQAELAQLRADCEYESRNNPYVAGIIETYVQDFVGQDGPTLNVQSDDPAWSAQAEMAWRAWWRMPDLREALSGPEWLSLCVRSLWTAGEHITQLVWTPNGLRLAAIHPRRLSTWHTHGCGVEVDAIGRPVAYMILNETPWGVTGEAVKVPANQIIHDFRRLEADQRRGAPWVAPSIQTAADLREFDKQVLDAQRVAAHFAALITPPANGLPLTGDLSAGDGEGLTPGHAYEFARLAATVLPPGCTVTQMAPQQPGNNYLDVRMARLAELGRPVGMPVIMINLDSSSSSYASARLDSQTYTRSLASMQGQFERSTLDRCLAGVLEWEVLAGRLAPKHRGAYRGLWNWPRIGHVDPQKEAEAARTRIETHVSTITEELAKEGKTLESHLATLCRERELGGDLLGLGPVPSPVQVAA